MSGSTSRNGYVKTEISAGSWDTWNGRCPRTICFASSQRAGVGAWAAQRTSRSRAEASSAFSSPSVTLGGPRAHNVMGLEEACELLKGDLPFSRPSPKKNGWILVMNNQNSQQRVMRVERHISSPREVRWGCDEEE